jgi:hypothetical protein
MARKRYGAEQIIGYLRQAEVMIGRGCTIEEVLREIDVTANTYYRWRKCPSRKFLSMDCKCRFPALPLLKYLFVRSDLLPVN